MVDTTDKASDDTKFRRIFWVTPNREVTIPVDDPIGKEKNLYSKYIFDFWKEEKPGNDIWKKGESIRKQFKKNTLILAHYNQGKPSFFKIIDNKPKENHIFYLNGYPDNTIRPDEYIKRAEAIKILNNIYGRKANEKSLYSLKYEVQSFTDLKKDKWYYFDILEASNSHTFHREDKEGNFETWTSILK